MKAMNQKTADALLINGIIYTMQTEGETAEAVAIAGDKILFVGKEEEARKFTDANSQIFDLEGKTILPGFIDAHAHPLMSACWLSGVTIPIDYSKDQVLACVAEYIAEHPEKNSYFGIGYAEWLFDSKGPRKEELDKICSEKPIFLLGSSGHEGWCNSITLQMAEITKDTPDPIPTLQYYERDADGTPTGHIVECEPTGRIFERVNFFEEKVVTEALEEILKMYSTIGVTAIADCGCFDYAEKMALPIVVKKEKEGALPQRIMGCVMVEARHKLKTCMEALRKKTKLYNSDELRINTLKIVNDGTMESRSASLFEPYNEDQSMVEPMVSGSELYDLSVEAAKEGFDIHIHAIGDRAIHETLMAAKAVRQSGCADTRITNAHTDFVALEDEELFGKYGVIANTTGVWHYGNPEMNRIIGDRAEEQFKLLALIEKGAKMSLGSDLPVDEYGPEPLKGIQMCATRQLFGKPEAPVLNPPTQRLSVWQAVQGYTVNAAYQLHMEDRLGTITAGKYADLVVLENDIFHMDVNQIYQAGIALTIKGGKITFCK